MFYFKKINKIKKNLSEIKNLDLKKNKTQFNKTKSRQPTHTQQQWPALDPNWPFS